MPHNTYIRAGRFRLAAAVLLAAAVGAAGFKLYLVQGKISLYHKAQAAETAGRLLEAEGLYVSAQQAAGFFDYRSAEISAALGALQPVTRVKRVMERTAAAVAAAAASHDVAALAQADADYRAAKAATAQEDAEAQKRFADEAAAYGVEAKLAEAFAAERTRAAQRLTAAAGGKSPAADGTAAAADLLSLPASAFGGEAAKRKEVNALLQRYDIQILDRTIQTRPITEVLELEESLRKFYGDRSWEAAWLAPKIEKYALGALGTLEKGELGKWVSAAQQMLGYKSLYPAGGKVAAYADKFVQQRLARAEQLASARKYDEALGIYKALAPFRDTSSEVDALEKRRLENDPARLLQQAGVTSKLTAAAGQKSADGTVQAAAVDTEQQRLVLAQLFADGHTELAEGPLPAGLKVRALRFAGDFSPQGRPVLLLEAESSQRKARYAAFELQSAAALRPVLDVEADAVKADGQGAVTADRPLAAAVGGSSPQTGGGRAGSRDRSGGAGDGADGIGGAAGAARSVAKGYYAYREDRYVLVRTELEPQKPDPATDSDGIDGAPGNEPPQDIRPQDLPKYKNKQVRFQVSITEADGESAMAKVGGRVLLLTGPFSFRIGNATITGVYVGEEPLGITEDGESQSAYHVRVTGIGTSRPSAQP